jgi:hypothetical protein
MSDFEEKSGSFFRGLIFGILVGAGLYYFLTSTEEGEKLKAKIKERSQDAFGDLAEIIEELEEKGEFFKKKAELVREDLENKVRFLKGEEAVEAKSQLSQIDRLRERGRKAAKLFTRNGKPLKKTA